MTVLRFEDVSRHLEVAETQEHDDGMTWRTGGGKLYVCMNEGELEEFDGFTDLTQVKRFWSAHIEERGSYMHRLTKGACSLSRGCYEWKWCDGWRASNGLPEWVEFGEAEKLEG